MTPEQLLTYDGFVRAIARGVVADASLADDVAQEAWLRALRADPASIRSLPAWLTATARNLAGKMRRGASRRDARERLAARPERTPSAAEILEREDARRRIVNAVLALDEPYRETILLRFFENLPPREIARRMAVPVETVQTRTRRALERLRERLSGECSGAALLALAHLPQAVPVGAAAASFLMVMLMAAKAKLGLVAAALVAAVLLLLVTLEMGPQKPGADPAGSRPAAAAATLPATRSSAPVREALAKEAAQSREPVQLGALTLQVIWADDKKPAADVGVQIYEYGRKSCAPYLWHVTGEDGVVHFPRVVPGQVWIRFDRTDQVPNPFPILEPGEHKRLTVELPRGTDVHGIVVDASGVAVPGATVWGATGGSHPPGRVLATTDANGRFWIRSASLSDAGQVRGLFQIVARAEGHSPSPGELLEGLGRTRIDVRLVLGGPGGSLEGRALDPEGQPIAGARVEVGGWDLPPQLLSTDHEGRVRSTGLAPGMTSVRVHAPDLAPWLGAVEVFPSQVSRFEARLCVGASVAGRVSTSDGAPVGAATLRFRPSGTGPAIEVWGSSEPDGTFLVEHVAPGAVAAEMTTRERRRATATLQASSGERVRWDVVLPPTLELRGRVVDAAGHPLARWWVEQRSTNGVVNDAERDQGASFTDEQGRFHLPNLHDHDHLLEVTEHGGGGNSVPAVRMWHVRPSASELVVVVPEDQRDSVRFRGALVDAEGKPFPAAEVQLVRWGIGETVRVAPSGPGARFASGPHAPGEWQMLVRRPDAPPLRVGRKRLLPNETWDAGTIAVLPAGRARVTLERGEGVGAGARFDLKLTQHGVAIRCEITSEGDALVTEPLAPGEYEVRAAAENAASLVVPLVVRPGATTDVRIPVVPALVQRVRLEVGAGKGEVAFAHMSVRRSDGKVAFAASVWRTLWERTDPPFELALPLAPGNYLLAATTASGLGAEGSFEVRGSGAAPEPVVLSLR